jgi:hypothetical protein
MASRFTQGELAALRIIGDECRQHGCCALHLDAIAARAGVCSKLATDCVVAWKTFFARNSIVRMTKPPIPCGT